MAFAKALWKLLVGIKDLFVLILMLMFFAILFVALRGTPDPVTGEGVLVMDLDGVVVEEAAGSDPTDLLLGSSPIGQWQLGDLKAALSQAEDDDRVKAVALDLDGFLGGGSAAMKELGDAIADFRSSGKTVTAYATGYAGDGYQLAAHADEIHLDPLGLIAFAGPGGSNLYFAELFDRLGVTANIYRVGDYKSATEPYSRSDMSEEARRNALALAEPLFEAWTQDVMQARPDARVEPMLTQPETLFGNSDDPAQLARELNLADALTTRAAWHERLAELGGADEAALGGFRRIELADYIDLETERETGGAIGIVTIAGTIVDGTGGPGSAAGESIGRAIEEAMDAHDFEALVVRIDSPGGSVLASERIRLAIEQAKADHDIPVVASMGNVAASGGYWVATPADAIFAQPETITGSIGVFVVLPSFEGAMEKLGIGVDGIQTTPLSGEPDALAGPSPAADALFQSSVDGIYKRFVTLVADSRDLPATRVRELAGGRVWTGGMARQNGLVDRFGGLEEAIAYAAELAEIEGDPSLHYIARQADFGWLTPFLGARHADTRVEPLARFADQDRMLAEARGTIQSLLAGPSIQARCLECVQVGAVPPVTRDERGFWRRLLDL